MRHAGARFALKRIYEHGLVSGDYRVLVDRLWPRGIDKEDAAVDEWAKDVAPSTELRRWYGHDPEKFDEFARRYREELTRPPALEKVAHLRRLAREQQVTLLTATRDVEHSGARVLQDALVASLRPRRAMSRTAAR
jgi:uncharacterized protein YeaO (DUF488 family)